MEIRRRLSLVGSGRRGRHGDDVTAGGKARRRRLRENQAWSIAETIRFERAVGGRATVKLLRSRSWLEKGGEAGDVVVVVDDDLSQVR